MVFPQAERGLEGKEVLCQDCESDYVGFVLEPSQEKYLAHEFLLIHLFSDQFCLSMCVA